ncbi:hypothetical protein S40293_08807 [Stachybotrys chartarum IBT 40293]|nr:hypothetical protein S40293_08807 [Stachybotrys chartarum IBT 40293]
MSGGFSWCATSLFQLPQASAAATGATLSINEFGEITGAWRVVSIDKIPNECYVWGGSHPLIEEKLRLALTERVKHVLLIEPGNEHIMKGLLVKPLKRPPGKEGPIIKSQFIGHLHFHSAPQVKCMAINMTIGDTEEWNQLQENESAWNVLEENKQELESSVSSEENGNGQSRERQVLFRPNESWTELHDAAWKCDLMVKQLVSPEVDLDIPDELGSLWGGSESTVEKLLQKSPKELIHVQDQLGRTALDYAAERGSQNMVRSLLGKGADPDVQCCLDRQTALHRAIWRGSKEVIKILLEGSNGKKSDPGVKDNEGRTALYYAAEHGNKVIVDELLSHEDAYSISTDNGPPGLHWAAKGGDLDIVRLFLQLSINKQADVAAEDDGGRTVLYWAVKGGNRDICQLLVSEGADVMATDKEGRTMLHWAAEGGNKGMVWFCVEQGIKGEVKDKDGRTALHVAACAGNTATAWTFMKGRADKEAKDNNGSTALHIATKKGNLETLKALMEGGADKEAKESWGSTAIHIAVL